MLVKSQNLMERASRVKVKGRGGGGGRKAVAALRTVRRPLVPGFSPGPGQWNSEHKKHPRAWPFSEDRALGQSSQKPDLTLNTFSLLSKAVILNTGRKGPADPSPGRIHQYHPGEFCKRLLPSPPHAQPYYAERRAQSRLLQELSSKPWTGCPSPTSVYCWQRVDVRAADLEATPEANASAGAAAQTTDL